MKSTSQLMKPSLRRDAAPVTGTYPVHPCRRMLATASQHSTADRHTSIHRATEYTRAHAIFSSKSLMMVATESLPFRLHGIAPESWWPQQTEGAGSSSDGVGGGRQPAQQLDIADIAERVSAIDRSVDALVRQPPRTPTTRTTSTRRSRRLADEEGRRLLEPASIRKKSHAL